MTVVVIPALNEEEVIGDVVRSIPGLADRIMVVDNGSNDRTADRAGRRHTLARPSASPGRPGPPAAARTLR